MERAFAHPSIDIEIEEVRSRVEHLHAQKILELNQAFEIQELSLRLKVLQSIATKMFGVEPRLHMA